jgi:dimeric dUTPase (all-alpha-NTP-PPase superfamily)
MNRYSLNLLLLVFRLLVVGSLDVYRTSKKKDGEKNMKKLQEIQKQADKKIMANLSEEISLEGIIQSKIIALDIEISEFANEIEFFKYWKKNKGKENMLEELADCVAFILTIANSYKYVLKIDMDKLDISHDLNNTYMFIKSSLTTFYKHRGAAALLNILQGLFKIAKTLGITYEEIEEAYIRKSEINIQRQEMSY